MASDTFLFIFFIFSYNTFIHTAEGPLLFPHCSSLSRGPPWGAEPGFELGPAVQQADALLSELRYSLIKVDWLAAYIVLRAVGAFFARLPLVLA